MRSIGYRTRAMKLRLGAVVAWSAAAGFALLAVILLLAWRNPWRVRDVNAQDLTGERLEEIAKSSSPYIKISGIDLSYTGFYEAGKDGSILSYCYMGKISDEYVLVDMPVTDDGALSKDSSADGAQLKDTQITGQAQLGSEMRKWLAEDEDLSVEEYSGKYNISSVEIHVYHNDRERVRIYFLMLIVLAAGFTAVGGILRSESVNAEIAENGDKK